MNDMQRRFSLRIVPAVLLLVLALVTFVDVVGRDVFASPLRGSFDIISCLMALLVFSAVPIVARERMNIAVDLVDRVTSPVVKRFQAIFVEIVCAVVSGLVAWRLVAYAVEAWNYDDVTNDIYIPLWPIAGFCALMAALMALAHALNVFDDLRGKGPPA